MTRYFKCTRPDGTDFHTGTIDYAAALASGEPVVHPRPHGDNASGYLSVATVATDCTGFRWPCRLFAVEADDAREVGSNLPNKRAVLSLRVVEELPASQVFGPNGQAVVAVIDRARTLTRDEALRLDAAREAAWDAAWEAGDAALAELTRDLITPEQYDTLIGPWRSVVGEVTDHD